MRLAGRYRLLIAALSLVLSACQTFKVRPAPPNMAPPPPSRPGTAPVSTAGETRSEHGPVLLVERRGDVVETATRIIVDNPRTWELVRGLIEASHGPLPPGQVPKIQTVDSYLAELQAARSANPSMPQFDLENVRRQVSNDLKGHQVVIYRTISSSKRK
jgi:hypothetical protein